MTIIEKISNINLSGKGGAAFPVAKKWQMVKDAPGKRKYVVANGSEGEPGVKKDYYLLKNHPGEIINGIKIAVDFLGAELAFLYLNAAYCQEMAEGLVKIIGHWPVEIFKKPHSGAYIGGEETSLLNAIEGRRIEPRLRPPFPPQSGLWGYPTLVNNIETFYQVYQIAQNRYRHERHYTVDGDCFKAGVYCLDETLTIAEVLRQSGNYPDYDFFVQIGGAMSGEVLNSRQLDRPVGGCGSIRVYSRSKHEPLALIKSWVKFFREESCGQCTPCREGTMRLFEMLGQKKIDWQQFHLILANLSASSFCALGSSVPVPIVSYVKNVLGYQSVKEIININVY